MSDYARYEWHDGAEVRATVDVIGLPDVPRHDDVALLSADERQHALRFSHAARLAAFVTTRAALRRLLSAVVGVEPGEIELENDPMGRPFVRQMPASRRVDFNVAHCREAAAIAIAPAGDRVGVDIQGPTHAYDLRRLVPRVMGPRETQALSQLDGDDFCQAFIATWTRKEAVLKAVGCALMHPLRSLDMPDLGDRRGHLQRVGDIWWRVLTVQPREGMSLSVAMPDTLQAESALARV